VAECNLAIEVVAVMLRWLPHNWDTQERCQVESLYNFHSSS